MTSINRKFQISTWFIILILTTIIMLEQSQLGSTRNIKKILFLALYIRKKTTEFLFKNFNISLKHCLRRSSIGLELFFILKNGKTSFCQHNPRAIKKYLKIYWLTLFLIILFIYLFLIFLHTWSVKLLKKKHSSLKRERKRGFLNQILRKYQTKY